MFPNWFCVFALIYFWRLFPITISVFIPTIIFDFPTLTFPTAKAGGVWHTSMANIFWILPGHPETKDMLHTNMGNMFSNIDIGNYATKHVWSGTEMILRTI